MVAGNRWLLVGNIVKTPLPYLASFNSIIVAIEPPFLYTHIFFPSPHHPLLSLSLSDFPHTSTPIPLSEWVVYTLRLQFPQPSKLYGVESLHCW